MIIIKDEWSQLPKFGNSFITTKKKNTLELLIFLVKTKPIEFNRNIWIWCIHMLQNVIRIATTTNFENTCKFPNYSNGSRCSVCKQIVVVLSIFGQFKWVLQRLYLQKKKCFSWIAINTRDEILHYSMKVQLHISLLQLYYTWILRILTKVSVNVERTDFRCVFSFK